jgi:hypothetical protein
MPMDIRRMNLRRKGTAVALVLASLGGGAVGATVFGASSSSAASNTGATGSTGPTAPLQAPNGSHPPGAPGGKFVPNENATHEQSESSQREAQENAGQFPTVP